MKEFKFKKIDAFATQNSEGNPAGYVWLNSKDDINVDEMQQIAKELKGFVNEVGYIYQMAKNQFHLKFYSSEREVDFCGHATIAIMYDLIRNDVDLQKTELIQIVTNRGTLNVENRIESENAVFIMSPEPIAKDRIPALNEIAEHLKISSTEIDTNFAIDCINAGLTTLIVPIKSLSEILAIAPNLDDLKCFCQDWGIDIIEVFTTEVADCTNNFRTRVFAPTFGYLEDPATGSGNSAFGYYLLKHNLWKQATLSIEQNAQKDKFNIVKLQQQKSNNGNVRVLFGGRAITRIEGKYIIQNQ